MIPPDGIVIMATSARVRQLALDAYLQYYHKRKLEINKEKKKQRLYLGVEKYFSPI